MNKAYTKQRNLDMVQEIIDEVYAEEGGINIPLPRKLRKMLKKEKKKQKKKRAA